MRHSRWLERSEGGRNYLRPARNNENGRGHRCPPLTDT
jgi:hypothetical protein